MTVSPSLAEVIALDDDTIAALAWKHMRRYAEHVTFDRSPAMFPQVTYSVPTVELSNFTKAVIETYEALRTSAASLRDEDARDAARYRKVRELPFALDYSRISPVRPDKFDKFIDSIGDAATQPAAQERQA